MSEHAARVPRPVAPTRPAPARLAPVRVSAPVVARCPTCGGRAGGGECEDCRQHRLRRSAAGAAPAHAPPVVHEVLRSPGRSLDAGTRGEMERGFGHSFASVRVHDDARAADSARAVGAQAYAVGRDVVFGAGRYAPGTGEGRRLIAHELAHVVQQDGGASTALQPRLEVGPADGAAEREAEAAADAVSAGGTARVAGGDGPALRRFASREHKSLGDTATGGALVNVGGDGPDEVFELTHGDVVMLSGDYFSPEELFKLARIPGSKGTRKGTRDEIVHAVKWITEQENRKDARFGPGGIWHDFVFPGDVRAVVVERYQKLAAANQSHFVSPRGRDASGNPNPPKGSEGSAGTAYRKYHEQAISLAYDLGRTTGGRISHAMAMEAAAQHFLTDSFSAGHVRTPIGDIREYWSAKYPNFFYNLLHKIALDTATQANHQHDNVTTIFGSVQQIYEGIIAEMTKMAATLPSITLGDLLASVIHDFDNEHGLAVEGGGKVYGDGSMDNPDSANVTRGRAQAAIVAGNADVKRAFDLGAADAGGARQADDVVREKVRAGTPASGAMYAPETLVPRPDPAAPRQNWKADSIEQLWRWPMAGTSGPTFGAEITRSVEKGEIHHQLEELGKKFTVAKRWSGDLDLNRAYRNGFVAPLAARPLAGILDIVHWAPDRGLSGEDKDDISLVTGRELDATARPGGTTALHGMTLAGRARYVRQLIGGSVAEEEEALVERIFATTPAADRHLLYQRVEGHAWTGDWIEGYFTSDDEIYNALSGKRLDRVRKLINAGWTKPARSK